MTMTGEDTGLSFFNGVRISLATSEQIKSWSYGEVTKPETINYRTLRAEKEGLFDERIFGPIKDWECFCGKYKKIRYKGVTCDRCHVEVTRAKVRRERMGHIALAAPVAHVWFSKNTPSRIGLLLDLSPKNLERVLYFSQYLVVSMDEEKKFSIIEQLTQESADKIEQLDLDPDYQRIKELEKQKKSLAKKLEETPKSKELKTQIKNLEKEVKGIQSKRDETEQEERDSLENSVKELQELQVLSLLTEFRHRELFEKYSKYGEFYAAEMGAEAVRKVLSQINLPELKEQLLGELNLASNQKRRKILKRLHVIEALILGDNKPEWMILEVLPVLPPDLRPMVQLDGGRFATSDLNDLYRRVINRNNRLKRLLDLDAPEIIVRNEKRMLQEAVDALIDNGRRGRPILGSHNHKLKSLSDLLRGKQGRFRQNLLGKRVDYSGRSVIVVGPELALHQCGLPKKMALELFKPFVMHQLALQGAAPNIKSAKRMVEEGSAQVWDVLEEVIKNRPVLLNRAPTLHRLGIQAFEPVLIEGSAIRIHPLVCAAFNADFDGDQMAVHVPLSKKAIKEAHELMLSVRNLLSPASGEPLATPTLDIVMGCFYLTSVVADAKGSGKEFTSINESRIAFSSDIIDLRSEIKIPLSEFEKDMPKNKKAKKEYLTTTMGRIIFNDALPIHDIGFKNIPMNKKALTELTRECYRVLDNERTAEILDKIKNIGFHYATISGITIGVSDITVPEEKANIITKATNQIEMLQSQFEEGFITEDEKYRKSVDIWTQASDKLTAVVEEKLPTYGGMALMATSGAKGNIAQIKQMAGMRGLMSNPKGKIIDLPIKSSFREGLTTLEYFISTHGARKGLADTALRTADSGYLTRRLVDVCQDVIIASDDCGNTETLTVNRADYEELSYFQLAIESRVTPKDIKNVRSRKVIVPANEVITENQAEFIANETIIESVEVFTPATCKQVKGLCVKCYGSLPGRREKVLVGEAVGIIAAQSIGEPGTQLTMRTFHTGGIASETDITTGLPRVEELFEAREPKISAVIAETDGTVSVNQTVNDVRVIRITSKQDETIRYNLNDSVTPIVENGDTVFAGQPLAVNKNKTEVKSSKKEKTNNNDQVVSEFSGKVRLNKKSIVVVWERQVIKEYPVATSTVLLVKDGEKVKCGQQVTNGNLNPHDILRILGKKALQDYINDEVQKVYRSQGVTIHNKHIEVIVRQMLRRIKVNLSGDAKYLPGEFIDTFKWAEKISELEEAGKEIPTGDLAFLGVTKASLLTDSFLAAASFQETTKILTESSLKGDVDSLLGLKENVIIGRLTPARFDLTEAGRAKLNFEEDAIEDNQMSEISEELNDDINSDESIKIADYALNNIEMRDAQINKAEQENTDEDSQNISIEEQARENLRNFSMDERVDEENE